MRRWAVYLIPLLTIEFSYATDAKSPSPTASFNVGHQTSFRTLLNRDIDEALREILARDRLQVLDGATPKGQMAVCGPGGLVALTWSKESPEGSRWPITVLKVTGDIARAGLTVESYNDATLAHRMGRLEWSKDGKFLIVLTESVSLDGPGGELAVFITKNGQIQIVDRDVVRFVMTPDARHLVYERAKKPGDLLGPRVIVHSDGASGFKRVLHELAYPSVQVKSLGPFDGNGAKVRLALVDYLRGITLPRDVPGVVDLVKGQFLPH